MPFYHWSHLTSPEIERLVQKDCIALLPIGATEQHGPHLGVGADTVIAREMLHQLTRESTKTNVVQLPCLSYGFSIEHSSFSGTIGISHSLLVQLVVEITAQLAKQGIKKLILFNAHGGNSPCLDIAALEARANHAMHVVSTSWSRLIETSAHLEAKEAQYGIHGGQAETSLLLHLAPELVRSDELRDFKSKARKFDGMNHRLKLGGKGGLSWMAEDLNALGAVGNAKRASAALGKKLTENCVANLIVLISELAQSPVLKTKEK